MRISDLYASQVAGARQVQRKKKTEAASAVAGTTASSDRVEFSSRGVEVQRARLLAIQAPEVREDLVEEIFSQIRDNRYQVQGTDVAPRMIREHLSLAGF